MQGPGAAERPRFNPYKNSLRHYVLILHTGKRSCRDVRYLPKDTASKRELGLRLDVRDLAFKSHALPSSNGSAPWGRWGRQSCRTDSTLHGRKTVGFRLMRDS